MRKIFKVNKNTYEILLLLELYYYHKLIDKLIYEVLLIDIYQSFIIITN